MKYFLTLIQAIIILPAFIIMAISGIAYLLHKVFDFMCEQYLSAFTSVLNDLDKAAGR